MKSIIVVWAFITIVFSCSSPTLDKVKPIHLDDIHFIVTDEEAAIKFFQKHFGAREMAHPGDRFDLAHFLSLNWQDPTITITPIGPYADLPPERNQRWLDAKILLPGSEKAKPVYGVKWLAISTSSIAKARKELQEGGVEILKNKIVLPLENDTPAFSISGPDGFEIVIVERPEIKLNNSKYAIDHIQFLVKDIKKTQVFYEGVFNAKSIKRKEETISLQIADANLILSEPSEFGINPKDVSLRKVQGTIRIGLDHLGFLYSNINEATHKAEAKGYSPIFKPQRYIYKNKPTVYTFTAFSSPENLNIEMVQVDGRVGPHSYYMDQIELK